VVTQRKVSLQPGTELAVPFDAIMTTSGAAVWSVEIVPDKDFFPVNNSASTVVQVSGKPRVLVLHEEPKDMRAAVTALRQQNIDVDIRGKRGLPTTIEEMAAFDAILLSNVPAHQLTPRQHEMLRQYVTDLGGGLGMLGSGDSFGLGGYFKTPVEEVLPIVSRFEKEKERPSMALALVLDKSGSMEGIPIQLARQAAKLAVEMLTSRDQVAVIGFDSEAQVFCEMTPASDQGSIQAAIDSMAADGGTNMFPALEHAAVMLRTTSAKVKHVIVMTDGQTAEGDNLGLTRRLADDGATVSSVALGDGAARELLQQIAEAGNGRYYETTDPNNVPQIFTRETLQASRSAIKEDIFAPVLVTPHAALAGFTEAELPPVLGYAMAQPKPTAQVLLGLETGDPLLALSRHGLGMGLAYTSDLTDRWGAEMLSWENGGAFWAQLIRTIARRTDTEGMELSTQAKHGRYQLTITRTATDGSPVTGLSWTANSMTPDQNASHSMQEIGLGKYQLSVPLPAAGQLTLRAHDTQYNKLAVRHHASAYPAEYQLGTEPDAAVASIAPFVPEQSLADLPPVTLPSSVRTPFYLCSLLALLGSVLLRRV
jgi:Ca-activated chloride channel homolog